jgi:hypothetical protein
LRGGWRKLCIDEIDICLLFTSFCQGDKIKLEIRIRYVWKHGNVDSCIQFGNLTGREDLEYPDEDA